MRVLGIDPGLDGAMALVELGPDGLYPELEWTKPLPVLKKGRRRDYSWPLLFGGIMDARPDVVALELVTRPARLVRCQAKIEGWCIGRGVSVHLYTPVAWTRALDVGSDKRVHVAAAEQLWPETILTEEFRGPKGGIKDGPADAALIAYHHILVVGSKG